MSSKETDLAALLIAVFAVGITTATAPGSWDGIDSIVCIPVFVVLLAYSLTGSPQEARERILERLAVTAVLILIVSTFFAFPVQQIAGLKPNEHNADLAFYWALIPGCLAGGILWHWTGPVREKRFWKCRFWSGAAGEPTSSGRS